VFHVVKNIHSFGPTLESLPPSIIGFTVRAVQMITTEATRTQTDLSVSFTGAVLGETEVRKFCVTKCTYCIIYSDEENRILKRTCGYENSSTWVL
jgi:hypothetical protein